MELTASAVQYVTWSGMEQAVFDASLTSKVQPRSCDRCYTRKSKVNSRTACILDQHSVPKTGRDIH